MNATPTDKDPATPPPRHADPDTFRSIIVTIVTIAVMCAAVAGVAVTIAAVAVTYRDIQTRTEHHENLVDTLTSTIGTP